MASTMLRCDGTQRLAEQDAAVAEKFTNKQRPDMPSSYTHLAIMSPKVHGLFYMRCIAYILKAEHRPHLLL